MDFMFFLNSALLGVGLAMDAFSVSLANGLHEQDMKKRKICAVAGVFAFFQALMPMLGWVCVHTIVSCFTRLEKFVPYVALVLLSVIGTKMIIEGFSKKEGNEPVRVGIVALLIQGVATSIDALSVGFTIASYTWVEALVCVLVIALVTFILCVIGVILGKKFGTKFSDKATAIGGIILVVIGLEIFITGLLGL